LNDSNQLASNLINLFLLLRAFVKTHRYRQTWTCIDEPSLRWCRDVTPALGRLLDLFLMDAIPPIHYNIYLEASWPLVTTWRLAAPRHEDVYITGFFDL